MVKVKVENIVTSARISSRLNLQEVGDKMIGSVYNPDQFEGVLYKLLEPRAAFLILKNGKAVCAGLKKLDDVRIAYARLMNLLKNEGIETVSPDDLNLEIKSIVAYSDLSQKIDLEAVVNVLEDDVEYDPETFPGVVYHLSKPRSTALIFSGGKVVFTGMKSMDELTMAVDSVLTTLEEEKVIVV